MLDHKEFLGKKNKTENHTIPLNTRYSPGVLYFKNSRPRKGAEKGIKNWSVLHSGRHRGMGWAEHNPLAISDSTERMQLLMDPWLAFACWGF